MRVMQKPYKTQEFGANGHYALSRKNLCRITLRVLYRSKTSKWVYQETI